MSPQEYMREMDVVEPYEEMASCEVLRATDHIFTLISQLEKIAMLGRDGHFTQEGLANVLEPLSGDIQAIIENLN